MYVYVLHVCMKLCVVRMCVCVCTRLGERGGGKGRPNHSDSESTVNMIDLSRLVITNLVCSSSSIVKTSFKLNVFFNFSPFFFLKKIIIEGITIIITSPLDKFQRLTVHPTNSIQHLEEKKLPLSLKDSGPDRPTKVKSS